MSSPTADGRAARRTIVHAATPSNILPFAIKGNFQQQSHKFENSDLDHKLRQKFSYFLQDLIRVTTLANSNLPMSLTDERGVGLDIVTFIKRNGPKYIFQFIQNNSENLQLIRTAFSMLIISLSFLRKVESDMKSEGTDIVQNDSKSHHSNGYPHSHHGNSSSVTNLQHKTAQNQLAEERAWVSQATSKINDSISVSSCMSIFITTHDALTQELILNLVANLLVSSDDALVQMLTVPSVFNRTARVLDEKDKQQILSGQRAGRPHSRAATSETTDSRRHHFGASSSNHLNTMGNVNATSSGFNAEHARASFRGERGSIIGGGSGNGGGSGTIGGLANGSKGRNLTSAGSMSDINANNGNGSGSSVNGDRRNSAALALAMAEEGLVNPSTSSCLSYMLSVVVLQKNHHSLLAAAADVLIIMARDASVGLCENIARTSTCPLPLLAAVHSLSHNTGSRGRNLGNSVNAAGRKFSVSSDPDSETLLMPINPLTGKVIDWAGVKVLLKFLHRYHSMMSSKDKFLELLEQHEAMGEGAQDDFLGKSSNTLTGLRASLLAHVPGSAVTPLQHQSLHHVNHNEDDNGEFISATKMMSEEAQHEFLSVHDRVFVALCTLLKGAPNIATYLLQLPGAMDVMQLSSLVFLDRQPSVASPSSLQKQQEQSEEAAVNIAMNTLQIEKQRQQRQRQRGTGNMHLTNTSALSIDHLLGTVGLSTSHFQRPPNLTLNMGDTGSLNSSGNHQRSLSMSLGTPKSAPSPLARGHGNSKHPVPGNNRRLANSAEGSKHGKKLMPLTHPALLPSAPKAAAHTATITLSAADNTVRGANTVDFTSPAYQMQTETKGLYKQNARQGQEANQNAASDLQFLAVHKMVHQLQGPLHAQPSVDSLLHTSLQIIDRETKESVIHGQSQQQRLAAATQQQASNSIMYFDASASSTQIHQPSSSAQGSAGDEMLRPRTSTSSPNGRHYSSVAANGATGLAATRDFFGALPRMPQVPRRIEAKDAIIPEESLGAIRKKFQKIADGALNQIKSTGKLISQFFFSFHDLQ